MASRHYRRTQDHLTHDIRSRTRAQGTGNDISLQITQHLLIAKSFHRVPHIFHFLNPFPPRDSGFVENNFDGIGRTGTARLAEIIFRELTEVEKLFKLERLKLAYRAKFFPQARLLDHFKQRVPPNGLMTVQQV